MLNLIREPPSDLTKKNARLKWKGILTGFNMNCNFELKLVKLFRVLGARKNSIRGQNNSGRGGNNSARANM